MQMHTHAHTHTHTHTHAYHMCMCAWKHTHTHTHTHSDTCMYTYMHTHIHTHTHAHTHSLCPPCPVEQEEWVSRCVPPHGTIAWGRSHADWYCRPATICSQSCEVAGSPTAGKHTHTQNCQATLPSHPILDIQVTFPSLTGMHSHTQKNILLKEKVVQVIIKKT